MHDNDTDSTLGDGEGSDADYCSVTDSVYDYPVENGHTYHAVCVPNSISDRAI